MLKQYRASTFLFMLIGLSLPFISLAQPIYGPVTLERTTGQPSQYTDTFLVCNPDADYRLIIDPAVGSNKQVASASVTLNGEQVVRPHEFKQQGSQLEKAIKLQSDNRLDIDLAGIPGTALALSVECVSGCLGVEFEQPIDGATIASNQVLASGRVINGTGEVGVALEVVLDENPSRFTSLVNANHFYAPVTLQPGVNALTAMASDACGYQAEQTVSLHVEEPALPLSVSAYPPSGLVDYDSGMLSVALESEIVTDETISVYAWDLDGDGMVDRSGAELEGTRGDYAEPGIYQPTLTVTTASGQTATATAVVQVFSPEQLDAVIQPKWAGMKRELGRGDVDAALQRFAESSQGKYRISFERLGERRAEIFAEMKELRLVYVKDRIAKYDIERDLLFDGELHTISYPVYFSKDNNGIWKIDQF